MNTFLASMFAIGMAYANGYSPALLLAFFSFAVIQLVEFFLWKQLTQASWNAFWTLVSFLVVTAQPYATLNLLAPGRLKTMLVSAYTVLIGVLVLARIGDMSFMKTTVAANGHLAWGWLPDTGLSLTIFSVYSVLLLFPLFYQGHLWIAAFITATLLFSLYNYWKSGTWGSMWCWSANAMSLVLLASILFGPRILRAAR